MSLREALAAAMAGDPDDKQESAAPVEDAIDEAEAPVAAESEEDVTYDATDAEAEEEPAEEVDLSAPSNWSSEDREEFEALPTEARDFVLRRYKSMEGDYTEKTKQLSQDRSRFEKLEQVLAPHREQFALNGVDEAAAIGQLLQAQKFLQTQPVEALRWLAQSANVDLSQLSAPAATEDDPDEWVDPHVKQLQHRLSEQEKYLTALREQQQRESEAVFLRQVEAFHGEKAANGELAHPFMDDVMPQMTALLQSQQATSLQDAYDKAVWMIPEVRGKVLNSAKEKQTEEQTRRVKRAKRAGREVKSEVSPVEPTRPLSLRETLQQAIAASN